MRGRRGGMICNKGLQQDSNWGRCDYIVSIQNPQATRKKGLLPVYLQQLFVCVFKRYFCFQDEPSQHDSYFMEEGSTTHPPPPPVAASSSSQLRSSQLVPQRSLRVDLSQDASVWSGFSQSLSLSQSSQGRQGLLQASQASQPKKKKSRMGF